MMRKIGKMIPRKRAVYTTNKPAARPKGRTGQPRGRSTKRHGG